MPYIGNKQQVALFDAYTKGQADALLALKLDANDALGGTAQSWQDVTASRSAGVTYTNTTGRPILVSAEAFNPGRSLIDIRIEDLVVARNEQFIDSGSSGVSVQTIVPNGVTYSVVVTVGSLNKWAELR